MCDSIVFRSLLYLCVISVLLETSLFFAEGKFRYNADNPATFSDVTLRMEAFYSDGRPFKFKENKIFVFVNTENCWYLDKRRQWKKKMKCILRDVPETMEIESYNQRLHNDSMASLFGYNGYH